MHNINNFTAVHAKYVHFTLHLLYCLLVLANGYCVIILKLNMAIDYIIMYPMIYLVLQYLQDYKKNITDWKVYFFLDTLPCTMQPISRNSSIYIGEGFNYWQVSVQCMFLHIRKLGHHSEEMSPDHRVLLYSCGCQKYGRFFWLFARKIWNEILRQTSWSSQYDKCVLLSKCKIAVIT